MRLFHFSDDPDISEFVPRPVLIPSQRPAGREWLNGPLVWAIEEEFDFLYHFPRNCPRILIWARADTGDADRSSWLGTHRAAAYVEDSWLAAIETAELHRYEMPAERFETLNDAGMWVSRHSVIPVSKESIRGLPDRLRRVGVDLRVVESLAPLRGLWGTTLHTSGIRLRNSKSWTEG